jgi:hypothetical protein
MIATARERIGGAETPAWGREDTYALRRDLVRRLQASTRGVTRKERVAAWRGFAEAWREAVLDGRLAEFSGILKGEREVLPGAGMLGRLAAGLGAVQVREPASTAVSRPEVFLQREGAASRDGRSGVEPTWGARTRSGQGDRQVELFAPGLVAQTL